MQLNKTISIIPGTETQVFNIMNATYDTALRIMTDCKVKWAEAISLDGASSRQVKTPDELQQTFKPGLSLFSCRLSSPDGIGARVTIEFVTGNLCLTCAPEMINAMTQKILQAGKMKKQPAVLRQRVAV